MSMAESPKVFGYGQSPYPHIQIRYPNGVEWTYIFWDSAIVNDLTSTAKKRKAGSEIVPKIKAHVEAGRATDHKTGSLSKAIKDHLRVNESAIEKLAKQLGGKFYKKSGKITRFKFDGYSDAEDFHQQAKRRGYDALGPREGIYMIVPVRESKIDDLIDKVLDGDSPDDLIKEITKSGFIAKYPKPMKVIKKGRNMYDLDEVELLPHQSAVVMKDVKGNLYHLASTEAERILIDIGVPASKRREYKSQVGEVPEQPVLSRVSKMKKAAFRITKLSNKQMMKSVTVKQAEKKFAVQLSRLAHSYRSHWKTVQGSTEDAAEDAAREFVTKPEIADLIKVMNLNPQVAIYMAADAVYDMMEKGRK